eukprot:gene2552-4126_t
MSSTSQAKSMSISCFSALAAPLMLVLAVLSAPPPCAAQNLPGMDTNPPNRSMTGVEWGTAASTAHLLANCEKFDDLYTAIDDDLSLWKENGISRKLLDATSAKYTTLGNNKGITLGFAAGKAYVVGGTPHKGMSHHAGLVFTYVQVMKELELLFGASIPDVEFVIATSDKPMVKLDPEASSTVQYPPVMRFCSSEAHADIAVPNFHFYTKHYDQKLLAAIPAINKNFPWADRQPLLFGRFSRYLRFIDSSVNQTLRWGMNGSNICEGKGLTQTCKVRQHLFNISDEHRDIMDVRSSPQVPMPEQARYKYLLSVDGQALSSRQEQLMTLGSLIFKEESGYTTFYYHLMKPYKHYMPFWERTPDNLFERLEWAKSNDQQAKQIAYNAQAFALKYLGKRTRACYWLKLLTEMSKLLKFKPGPGFETNPKKAWIPVREYLETVARTFDEGKWYRQKIGTFVKL